MACQCIIASAAHKVFFGVLLVSVASPVTLLCTSFAMLPAKVSAAWPWQNLHVFAAERD